MLAGDRCTFRSENEYLPEATGLKFSLTVLCGTARSNNRNPIVMPMFLAMDAGGTSTRAVLLDAAGRAFGYGRSGTGNPTAAGIGSAVAAIGTAADRAATGFPAGPTEPLECTIAMAGQQTAAFSAEVSARLAALGVQRVSLQPDLLGIFHSGTHEREGYALIAGTGSVAARVRDGRLERIVGGRGWLLGDAGSGFWIGHRVARTAIAALDGAVAPTGLTELVLAAAGIEPPSGPEDQARALIQLFTAVHAGRPVALSAFAPLAFEAYQDPAARAIVLAASEALADLITAVRVPELSGPVIGGGSVLVHGLLAAPAGLRRELAFPGENEELVAVADGVVGAAVLALRGGGIDVDAGVFRTIQAEVARVATRAAAG